MMSFSKIRMASAAVVFAVLAGTRITAGLAGEEAAESASQVISRLQSTLIEVMKEGAKLGPTGRYEKLAPVVKSTHHFESVARIALGKHWSALSDIQKKQFVDDFTRLGIGTYAFNFESYAGEAFKIVSEQPRERGQILVRSTLTKSDGGEVQFNYVLDKTGSGYQIINIIVDGVSDLALKRAEYQSIIEKEGFDALMKKVAQKIQDLKTVPDK